MGRPVPLAQGLTIAGALCAKVDLEAAFSAFIGFWVWGLAGVCCCRRACKARSSTSLPGRRGRQHPDNSDRGGEVEERAGPLAHSWPAKVNMHVVVDEPFESPNPVETSEQPYEAQLPCNF